MWYLYLFPMLFPFIGSIVALTENDKLSELSSIVLSFATLCTSVFLLFVQPVVYGLLYIDGFSKIMLFVISIIYFTTTVFSATYMKHVRKPLLSRSHYYMFLNLFVLSMFFSVTSNNLGLLWVGIEATTITSALLVAIDNDEASLESSWRYIIIVSTGLIMSLVGVMLVYASFHTLQMNRLLLSQPTHPKLLAIGAALTIAGFSTKAGIFPMHTWLPDVHGRSIAPVSAIFSGVLLPTALFGIYRIVEIGSLPHSVRTFAFVLGFSTVVFASIFLVAQKFYKRMFAYSSMENMGVILMGLAINSKYSFLGAVTLIVAHAFAKSSAFYTTGNILAIYKTRDIHQVKGLIKTMPLGTYNLILSALAVTGAPPFGTFVGEMIILYAIYAKIGLTAALCVALFLVVAFLSVNYKVAKMSFSICNDPPKQDNGGMHLFAPVLNTLLAILSVFAIGMINNLLSGGIIK